LVVPDWYPSALKSKHRHARSKHGSQRSGDAALLLPVTAFIRLRISAPELIRLFYLLEAFVSERPFARPQRLLSFENHRSEVKAPDLFLRRNSELFFQPVRPYAPTLDDVYHATGDVRRAKPVAVSRAQNSLKRCVLLRQNKSVPFVLLERSACCNAAETQDLEISFPIRLPHASANYCRNITGDERTHPLPNSHKG
jgi:hypothetical protein